MPYDPNIGKGMSEDEYLRTLPDSIKIIVCKRKPAHVNEWCCRDTTYWECPKINKHKPIKQEEGIHYYPAVILLLVFCFIVLWDLITKKF